MSCHLRLLEDGDAQDVGDRASQLRAEFSTMMSHAAS